MMPLQNYNANTAGEQGDTYRSGSSWMQPSLLMQREKESKSGSEPVPGYTTIDDVIRMAKDLLAHLSQLGEYKHPFDVRRGRKEVVKMVERDENSKTLKAGSKTYFLDIRETKGGKPYLMITESRFKGEGEERERSTIIVFQENALEFAEAVSQMTEMLE
jgi:hypothetical protein